MKKQYKMMAVVFPLDRNGLPAPVNGSTELRIDLTEQE